MHKKTFKKGKKTAHKLQHLGICEVHVQPQKYKCPEMGEKENTQKHFHRCPAQKKEGAGVVLGVKNKKSLFLATPHPAAGGVLKV